MRAMVRRCLMTSLLGPRLADEQDGGEQKAVRRPVVKTR
jgi:hypothetical protein